MTGIGGYGKAVAAAAAAAALVVGPAAGAALAATVTVPSTPLTPPVPLTSPVPLAAPSLPTLAAPTPQRAPASSTPGRPSAPASVSPLHPATGGQPSSGSPTRSAAASSSSYAPPLHGTRPHGEGTALSSTQGPAATPAPPNCTAAGNDEVVVVGRSCGQQQADGSYQGHVTILALAGRELLGLDSTSAGTTPTGSLAPLYPALGQVDGGLSQICTQSQGGACLTLLGATSTTTSTGSHNSFSAASASLASGQVSASALSSNGDLSQSGGCQTASGGSSIASASAGGSSLLDLAKASDASTACPDPSQDSQQSSSQVLGGPLAPVSAAVFGTPGCADGTPDTTVSVLGVVPLPASVATVECNATDADGAQAQAPYGTNEGLTVVLLGALGVHAPSAESLARPPAAPAPPAGGSRAAGLQGRPAPASTSAALTAAVAPGAPIAAPATAVAANGGRLAFTGTDVLLEALGALALLGAGTAVVWATRRPATRPTTAAAGAARAQP